MKIKNILLSLGLIALGMSGCDEGEKSVTGISIDRESITLDVDALTTLIPYPVPWDAAVSEKFTWTSDDRNIARVNNRGQVLGFNPGETDLVCHYGNLTAKVHVKVNSAVSYEERLKALGVKGFWDFNDPADMTRAIVGKPLELVNGCGSFTLVNGPREGESAIRIPHDERPAGTWLYNYIKCFHNIPANGGGVKVNKYTLVYDVWMPVVGVYYSLLNNWHEDGDADGDIFLRPGRDFGFRGHYTSANNHFNAETWYRFIFVVDNEAGILTYYLNGEEKARGGVPFTVDASMGSLATDFIELFGDEDGENGQGNDLLCASFAIFDRALTREEVTQLGNIRIAIDFRED